MKNIKKIILVVFSLLLFTFAREQASAQAETPNQRELESFVTDYAMKLHRYFNYGSQLDKESIPKEVASRLEVKEDIYRANRILYGNQRMNSKLSAKLLKVQDLGDGQKNCYIQVVDSFNYTDLPNIDSEEAVVYIIQCQDNEKNLAILNCSQIDNSIDAELCNSSNLQEAKKMVLNEIQNYDELMKATIFEEKKEDRSSNVVAYSISNSSRDQIVQYARNNYYRTHPQSGNGRVPYYDFSTINGSYDCTNFVSHALLAGGAKTSASWHYNSLSDRTPSWSGVNQFYSFITSNNGVGPKAYSKVYAPYSTKASPSFELGDIVQFHNGSTWRHSTVVTGKYTLDYYGEKCYSALVTGRTSSTQRNNNQKVLDMISSKARTLRITGLR